MTKYPMTKEIRMTKKFAIVERFTKKTVRHSGFVSLSSLGTSSFVILPPACFWESQRPPKPLNRVRFLTPVLFLHCDREGAAQGLAPGRSLTVAVRLADVAEAAKRWFRKPDHAGANPAVGSLRIGSPCECDGRIPVFETGGRGSTPRRGNAIFDF